MEADNDTPPTILREPAKGSFVIWNFRGLINRLMLSMKLRPKPFVSPSIPKHQLERRIWTCFIIRLQFVKHHISRKGVGFTPSAILESNVRTSEPPVS